MTIHSTHLRSPISAGGCVPSAAGDTTLTHLLTTTSGQQYELLDWLNEVTFPTEARFIDVDFARRAYELIVKRIINSGVLQMSFTPPTVQVSNSDAIDNNLLLLRNVTS
jgi:cytosine/adenosine deaminase-related metal-dependent hydrolase